MGVKVINRKVRNITTNNQLESPTGNKSIKQPDTLNSNNTPQLNKGKLEDGVNKSSKKRITFPLSESHQDQDTMEE